jgi:hypothetical protein
VTGYHDVRPYRRKDGTPIRGHRRRNPAPRIGVRSVVLFIALLIILGSLAHAHPGGSSSHSKSGQTQPSAATATKTP